MLDRINETVGEKDTLYILGDFTFRGGKPIEYRSRINCKDVHLILGNHDRRKDYEVFRDGTVSGFASVQDVKEVVYCNQRIYLSHYAARVWPASHKGSYMLYGHSHSKLDAEDRCSLRKTLDVGVDNTINYNKPFGEPWSFKEVQQLLNKQGK